MIYQSAQAWLDDRHKKVLLFGMSGLGKTYVSNMLRASGDWFHYSIDYRIGSHYLGEMMKTDVSRMESNFSFDDLEALSSFLGKPGDPRKGGIEIGEYMNRQALHEQAEKSALLDAARFIDRARRLSRYDHFICDSGGSICEVVDPEDVNDPVLKSLSKNLLLVWIEGPQDLDQKLLKRFNEAPKPMCYRAEFLAEIWSGYLLDNNVLAGDVDPDDFIKLVFSQALARRRPLYRAMAEKWGVTVSAQDVARATTPPAFDAMIAAALEKHYA